MDLGSLLNPTDPNAAPAPAPTGTTMDTQAPAPQGEWSKFMADPVNRAGLLGFGLQMLSGGWGNGQANLAQAVGAGVESAAGAGKVLESRADTEQKRGDILTRNQQEDALKREELASQEKRTGMIVAGKKDVASVRAGLDKTAQQGWWKIYKATQDNLALFHPDMDPAEVATQAQAAADAAYSSAPQGSPGGVNQANSGTTGPGGTTPPPAQPAASGAPTGAAQGGISWQEIVQRAGGEDQARAIISDPQKRAQIERKRGAIQGLPADLSGVQPSYGGLPQGNPSKPGYSPTGSRSNPIQGGRDQAGAFQAYLAKDGSIRLKSVFGTEDTDEVVTPAGKPATKKGK